MSSVRTVLAMTRKEDLKLTTSEFMDLVCMSYKTETTEIGVEGVSTVYDMSIYTRPNILSKRSKLVVRFIINNATNEVTHIVLLNEDYNLK